MGIIQRLKDVLVPDSEQGVHYKCTQCGAHFDTAREECPSCGSTETKEVEGFGKRPE